MRKERLAESLLALVTPRERAASTVWDIMEQARLRGDFGFWCDVLRTICALLWRSFAAEPSKLLWLGLRGSLLGLLLSNVGQLLAVAVSFVIFQILAQHYPRFAVPGGPFNPALPAWVPRTYYALIFGAPVLSMFYVGRWVARRSPGREMTAVVTFIGLQYPLAAITNVVVFDTLGSQPPIEMMPLAIAVNVAAVLANLAGAVHVRRKVAR